MGNGSVLEPEAFGYVFGSIHILLFLLIVFSNGLNLFLLHHITNRTYYRSASSLHHLGSLTPTEQKL